MEKLKMHSIDKVEENIEKIGALFPNALTETIKDGKTIRTIDFDILKQELSDSIVEGPKGRYQFTWPDKKESILLANAPIAKTLRPCREESINFDTTENLYIEGDNLEVLKLLQETYLGKVKMIYIDPPYNTGHDFVYEDDFSQSTDEYLANSGQFTAEGERLVANLESNGRFHTDWLNMMYPRLKLAKDLLTDDGVIFISIDDNEVENLKKICNEIFGEVNFIANIVWQKKTSPDARMDISSAHDYILIYSKQKNYQRFLLNSLPYDEERLKNYKNPDNDKRGPWASVDITGQTGRAPKSQFYKITTPAGLTYFPPEGRCWAMSEKTFNELYIDNRLWFGDDGNNRPRLKKFLSESEGMRPWTWWDNKSSSHNQDGNQEVMKLFDGKLVFDNPKPIKLIKKILLLATTSQEECITLDFFSGSATLADAVMQINTEDGGNRKYILVQIPQELKDTGNSFKANNIAISLGYKNICEIGKERIRRAGQKIKNEAEGDVAKNLDIGFRVLKVNSSNMEDVYYHPGEFTQLELGSQVDNIKKDRTPEDLLFQVMIDLGILLSAKIEEKTIGGKKVFNVADGYLLACFDADVTDETVKEIAKCQPYYAVFRDNSLANDNVATNFEQIFATYSPTTVRKVL
jgi:adenine-specific DNA-methyltransferase